MFLYVLLHFLLLLLLYERDKTLTMMYYRVITHHQLLILSAVSCSPILCRAALNTLHEGAPFFETLSCCCNQAESISILQLFIVPRCSRSILLREEKRRPSCSPRSFQSLRSRITANTSQRSFSAVISA